MATDSCVHDFTSLKNMMFYPVTTAANETCDAPIAGPSGFSDFVFEKTT
jgi:hypothetical protein